MVIFLNGRSIRLSVPLPPSLSLSFSLRISRLLSRSELVSPACASLASFLIPARLPYFPVSFRFVGRRIYGLLAASGRCPGKTRGRTREQPARLASISLIYVRLRFNRGVSRPTIRSVSIHSVSTPFAGSFVRYRPLSQNDVLCSILGAFTNELTENCRQGLSVPICAYIIIP